MADDEACASSEANSRQPSSSPAGRRELYVTASKLLRWEQPYHPVIVFAIITWLYLVVWYLDPSLVTGVAMTALVACVFDFAVPFVAPFVFSPGNWNAQKEKEFAAAREGLKSAGVAATKAANSLRALKDANPCAYAAVAVAALAAAAWLGSRMHNLMLAYFVTVVAASVPGLAHHGVFSRAAAAAGKRAQQKAE